MQGIELARGFYADIVRPWLDEAAPDLRHSAALLGYGSELLGFDDDMSKDHNWGPRVHIYVSSAQFAASGRQLVAAFAQVAPERYRGEPVGWRSRPQPVPNGPEAAGALTHGVEFYTLEGRLEASLAVRSLHDLTALDWLGFAEQKLLALTAGAVFHDDDDRLTQMRARLDYFPDDVWRYKIACQWGRIAEEQAFVGRTGFVGDDLGSRIIAARLARDIIRMGFLLERRYAPYAKWLGSGFSRLPIAALLSPHLEQALAAPTWQERGAALAAAYLELANRQNHLRVGAFAPVVGPYFERPFVTINADMAAAAARSAIVDPAIRALPLRGSLDQVSDLTPLLEDPSSSQRVMHAVLG